MENNNDMDLFDYSSSDNNKDVTDADSVAENRAHRNESPNAHNRRPSPEGAGARRPRPDGERRKNAGKRPNASASGNKRKPKKKGWSKKKKAILIAAIIIGFLLIIIGAIIAVIFHYINMIDIVTDSDDSYEILSSIPMDENDKNTSLPDSPEADKKALEDALKKNLLENSKDLVSDDNVLNILFIGCDGRSKDERGRSDSMILCSINKNTKKLILTSFLRDTWVEIPGVGPQRLNAAYVFGGPQLLIKTMEANFHVRIDKYVRVNFYSFMDAIDQIGGVNIEVTDEELEYLNQYAQHQNRLLGKSNPAADNLPKSGRYTLNGVQALAYARIRYVGTDFARTQRQRTIIEEMFKKAKDMSLSELDEFLERILPNITTNLEKGQIFSLILNASDYLSYERTQQSIPNLGSFKNMVIDGMMVLGIDFEKYNKELKESIYGK